VFNTLLHDKLRVGPCKHWIRFVTQEPYDYGTYVLLGVGKASQPYKVWSPTRHA